MATRIGKKVRKKPFNFATWTRLRNDYLEKQEKADKAKAKMAEYHKRS